MDSSIKKELQAIKEKQLEEKHEREQVVERAKRIKKIRMKREPMFYRMYDSITRCIKC